MQIHIFEYVILGGGVVAGYAAQEFVEQEIEPGQLAIVSADSLLPYERPPLSKGLLKGEKTTDDILINPPEFYEEHGIGTFLETKVTRVELSDKQLHTNTEDIIQFNTLLVATGAQPRKLTLPGANLAGIHYLRRAADSQLIRDAMETAQNAVIIGGGFIGMEVASAFASAGIAVTMVFPETRLMEGFFAPEMSNFFQTYFEERGVSFKTGTKPASFSGEDHVTGVTLESGDELAADLVVVGIGVEPVTGLFENVGIPINNGIIVNKYLESNRADILAAGDVANYYDVIFQKRRRAEHWDNAVKQGQHAARMMTASKRKQPDEFMYLRYFFSDVFDLSYEFWGDTSSADKVVYRGDMQGGSFSAWWLTGYRLDAVFVMNRPDEERELAPEWIKRRRRIIPEHLADDSQSLRKMTLQMI